MSIFYPITFALRTVNTVGTVYVCGKVGLEAYKQVRSMQKEALTAKQLRERFVTEYVDRKGEQPSEEEIQIALSSYDAIERPVHHRIKKFVNGVGEKLEQCIEGNWLEDFKKKDESKAVKIHIVTDDEEEN